MSATGEPSSPWAEPAADLGLPEDEVHVWRFDLAAAALRKDVLLPLLSIDERERMRRFHFDRHRDAFVAARGALRSILAVYAGRPAAELSFDYTKYGKPLLTERCGGRELRFNLSHAHEIALCAVTRGREIGVDVEWIRPEFAGDDIAERFFSPSENVVLRALPREARDQAFFACWTRKEAYIKGAGPGLSIPLDSFDVTLAPGEPARLLRTRPDAAEAARWTLESLSPGTGYAGALAVRGAGWRTRCLRWTVPGG